MRTTKIEWTEKTWNPVTGCNKMSEGCEHCYAENMSRRLCAMGKPATIFVCSMSDLFHKDVPFEFVDKVMMTIRKTPRHKYQILTKRADRMQEYFSTRSIPSNVWLGVTVEPDKRKSRLDCLRNLPAKVKFLSCEPLLSDLGQMDLTGINWVIVGGESGNQARPMQESWVLNIKEQADAQHIPFFFKQWGTWGADGIKRNKKVNGKLLQGKVVQQMPK